MTKAGIMDSVGNRLFPDLAKVPRRARISAERAVEAAQRATKCGQEPDRKPELMVYRYESKPRLVWEVRLSETRPRKRGARRSGLAGEHGAPPIWIVYVDAITGRVPLFYDNVQTAGPVSGNGTGYYSGAGTVNAYYNDTTYQLRDTTRVATGGPEIRTNDEDGASPSEDTNNNWNDLTTSPRDQNQGAEVDAHRFTGDVADYYQTVHTRNSFDGGGAAMNILVHYLTNLDNGYWDGSKVKLGDGSGAAPGNDYKCSDDWLAHEWTHAYT